MESYFHIIRLYTESFAVWAVAEVRKFFVIHQQITAGVYPEVQIIMYFT
jgi:hypothetical protein